MLTGDLKRRRRHTTIMVHPTVVLAHPVADMQLRACPVAGTQAFPAAAHCLCRILTEAAALPADACLRLGTDAEPPDRSVRCMCSDTPGAHVVATTVAARAAQPHRLHLHNRK